MLITTLKISRAIMLNSSASPSDDFENTNLILTEPVSEITTCSDSCGYVSDSN